MSAMVDGVSFGDPKNPTYSLTNNYSHYVLEIKHNLVF